MSGRRDQAAVLGCLVLACLNLAAAQPVAGPSEVPALAPALAPTSPDACGQCEYPVSGALGANITFRTVADTARYYSASSDGSILVFFDVLVNFTHPPVNVSAQDFTVTNGAVLLVGSLDNCTQYELRGYVRQDSAWSAANTTIALSTAVGAISDCAGAPFPALAASTSAPNKPICTFYTTNLAVSSQGAVLTGTTAAIALVCSQPVFGVTKSLFNVTLTPAPTQNEVTVGLLPTVLTQATNLTAAPSAAPGPSCLDFNVSQPAPVANAQTFYSTTIDLDACFYGQVEVALSGSVYSATTGASLPMNSLTFSRVPLTLVSVVASSLIKTPSMVDYVAPIPEY